MKLIARTLAILAAALLIVGITYGVTQASGSQSSAAGEMPAQFAQAAPSGTSAASSTSTSSTAQPTRGEHSESASLFGLVEVAKNLVIVGVITAVVAGSKRLFTRRNPRSGGPRPHAPPA
ncbi:hypothetical protein SE17_16615 [Kouleothrix aurantiaca]|uniref:Uncharacterized protein n=1 Tax=Kouleothrix aurantiaca TaxID=186479 RepID=A0A0P9DG43_9CHLR|nr:hypothetical protein SE17_16615 [Kouleothrix aurantiaca]